MVVAATLEDEDVDILEVDVTRIEADRVPLSKVLSNAGTVDAVITSPRSAERKLVDLSGYNLSGSDSSAPRRTPQDY